MANPSKRLPWVVEIKPPGLTRWFSMDAYRDADAAHANADLMRRRSPYSEFRVVMFTTGSEKEKHDE